MKKSILFLFVCSFFFSFTVYSQNTTPPDYDFEKMKVQWEQERKQKQQEALAKFEQEKKKMRADITQKVKNSAAAVFDMANSNKDNCLSVSEFQTIFLQKSAPKLFKTIAHVPDCLTKEEFENYLLNLKGLKVSIETAEAKANMMFEMMDMDEKFKDDPSLMMNYMREQTIKIRDALLEASYDDADFDHDNCLTREDMVDEEAFDTFSKKNPDCLTKEEYIAGIKEDKYYKAGTEMVDGLFDTLNDLSSEFKNIANGESPSYNSDAHKKRIMKNMTAPAFRVMEEDLGNMFDELPYDAIITKKDIAAIPEITEQQEQLAFELFDEHDINHDNQLNGDELKKFVIQIMRKLLDEALEQPPVNRQTFKQKYEIFMENLLKTILVSADSAEMFSEYDANKDNCISKEEYINVLKTDAQKENRELSAEELAMEEERYIQMSKQRFDCLTKEEFNAALMKMIRNKAEIDSDFDELDLESDSIGVDDIDTDDDDFMYEDNSLQQDSFLNSLDAIANNLK